MSEVQNWGRMFALPGKGGHSPLALLCSLCLLLEKKKKARVAVPLPHFYHYCFGCLKFRSVLCFCQVNQLRKSVRLPLHLFNLPEQLCCFFLFISSFNWLTSAKSFSTDRSLASTVEHIFCKEKNI